VQSAQIESGFVNNSLLSCLISCWGLYLFYSLSQALSVLCVDKLTASFNIQSGYMLVLIFLFNFSVLIQKLKLIKRDTSQIISPTFLTLLPPFLHYKAVTCYSLIGLLIYFSGVNWVSCITTFSTGFLLRSNPDFSAICA